MFLIHGMAHISPVPLDTANREVNQMICWLRVKHKLLVHCIRKEKKFLIWSLKSSTVLLNTISCHEDKYRMKIEIHFLVGSPWIEWQNEQTLKDSAGAQIESIFVSNFRYPLAQSGIGLCTENKWGQVDVWQVGERILSKARSHWIQHGGCSKGVLFWLPYESCYLYSESR